MKTLFNAFWIIMAFVGGLSFSTIDASKVSKSAEFKSFETQTEVFQSQYMHKEVKSQDTYKELIYDGGVLASVLVITDKRHTREKCNNNLVNNNQEEQRITYEELEPLTCPDVYLEVAPINIHIPVLSEQIT